ncbi:glycerol-3-phosphate 1-O-acyltransferase PlsY [Candidatus Neomarinimicrobiota bacterium]
MLPPVILLISLLCLCYLAGSLPTSIIIGRLIRGIDIREYGSGNAGSTNALRVLGWKPALAVIGIDIFKGWLAAGVLAPVAIKGTFGILPLANPVLTTILCGTAAVVGHTYTLFAGFRGGKGVGPLVGVLIPLFPQALPIGLGVWLLILFTTGYVSLGSVTAVTLLPVATWLRYGTLDSILGYFSIIITLFIWFTHRKNTLRLLQGTENRFEKAMLFRKLPLQHKKEPTNDSWE